MPENRYSKLTNQRLVAECLQTMAEDAWQEFVRRFEPVIASGVGHVARQYRHSSSELLRDLTHDVYIKLCRDEFRLLRNLRMGHEKALFSYLKLVAKSVAYDHFKRTAHETNAEQLVDESSGEETSAIATTAGTPEDRVLVHEIEDIVERITAGPNAERDRALFWLHHREGFAASALAAIPAFGLTQKGIEGVLHRVRASLRSELAHLRKKDKLRRRSKAGFSVS